MEKMQEVSFSAFESVCTRFERSNRRLFVVVLVLIAALIASNAGWIYYESQWQTVETTVGQEVTQDAENGTNNFVGGNF